MQIFDPEVPFVEEYILTPNSVSLISAKEFSHLHANVTAIKEHFDSVRDSLKDASAEEMP
jgi:threonine synthase